MYETVPDVTVGPNLSVWQKQAVLFNLPGLKSFDQFRV